MSPFCSLHIAAACLLRRFKNCLHSGCVTDDKSWPSPPMLATLPAAKDSSAKIEAFMAMLNEYKIKFKL